MKADEARKIAIAKIEAKKDKATKEFQKVVDTLFSENIIAIKNAADIGHLTTWLVTQNCAHLYRDAIISRLKEYGYKILQDGPNYFISWEQA